MCRNVPIFQHLVTRAPTVLFMGANFPSCPPIHISEHCYMTLVRLQLEYASSVWDNSVQCNIQKVESVQKRAARYACHDYRQTSSVTTMLQKLEWGPVQQRQVRSRAWMFYRIRNGLAAFPTAPYLTQCWCTPEDTKQYTQMHCNTSMYSHSFRVL